MVATNGQDQKPASLRDLREQRRLVLAQLELARIRQAHHLLEDIGSSSWPDYADFGGTDLFVRARTSGEWLPVSPSVPSDRRHGAQWPIARNEQEYDRIRQQARLLLGINSYAQGLLRNRTNYTIGKGFAYKAVARGLRLGEPVPEPVKQLLKATQDFIDRFLQRNRWNAVLNPEDALIAAATRERECYRRVCRDGEAFLRFWFEDDGLTCVRFVEPEQIRQGPDSDPARGETLGIRHQMLPFEDVETPESYYVTWQDVATASLLQKATSVGEWVDARHILHLKGPDTDAALKRGLSDFSFDVARALERAAKLQRNISVGAADRAAISEIIQYQGFTQQQIGAYLGGVTDRQETDPVTGRVLSKEERKPGTRRNIPKGMEFVPPPADNSTPAYMQGLQGDLRQGSAAFAAPEYWTGSAENGNYSSLETASAPPVKNGETEQEYYKAAFAAVVWRAIKHGVEQGLLHAATARYVDLQVEAPAVLHRNELEKAQADQIKVTGRWKSPQTCAMEDGLDPDVEMTNLQTFNEEMGQPGQSLPMPGLEGGPAEMPAPSPEDDESGVSDDDLAQVLSGLSESVLLESLSAVGRILLEEAPVQRGYHEFTDKAGRKFAIENGKRVPLRGQQEGPKRNAASRAHEATILKGLRQQGLPPDRLAKLEAKVQGMTAEQLAMVVAKAKALPKQAKPQVAPVPPASQEPRQGGAVSDYGLSKAKVEGDGAKNDALAASLLGQGTTATDAASLAGAPDDATVEMYKSRSDDGQLAIKVKFSGARMVDGKQEPYKGTREITKDPQTGQLVILNHHFEGKGVGIEMLARQVEQGVRLGASKIRTHAAGQGPSNPHAGGSGGMNGYYTWPRYGYDGAIGAAEIERLPGPLRRQVEAAGGKVSGLMGTAEGRDWWKANGRGINAELDLTPGSYSQRVLTGYLAEKKVKK